MPTNDEAGGSYFPLFVIIILSFVLKRDIEEPPKIVGLLVLLTFGLVLTLVIIPWLHLSESPLPGSEVVESGFLDAAMSTCLESLKRNPTNLSCLKRLRDIAYRRHREHWGPIREMHLFRFAMVCSLSILSSKLDEWGLGEVDWWPFAEEDEIMMVRPFVRKVPWRSVIFYPSLSK